jgi:hypothetical protein
MYQQNKLFAPYVLPVVKGSTVEFLSSDRLQRRLLLRQKQSSRANPHACPDFRFENR